MEHLHTHLPKYDIGVHFLTAKTFRSNAYLAIPNCAKILCEELESARTKYGFHVLAFVVMPDHVHLLIWWDAEMNPDLTISKIAWAIKGKSARRMVVLLKTGIKWVAGGNAFGYPFDPVREPRDQPHYRNWQYKIWQQGSGYDFNIYTQKKLAQKTDYIHANPVRAGLTTLPEDYPWSSAGFYMRKAALHPVTITPIAVELG